MPKAKKDRNTSRRGSGNPTAGRPPDPARNAAIDTLREDKISPLTKCLNSTSPKERTEALAAINNLLGNADCRRLLLKEQLVQRIMENMLDDSVQEVVVHAWGALRNVAVDEGYDQCIFMYRRGILTPIAAALRTISLATRDVYLSPPSLSRVAERMLWLYAENVLGLITSLCDTSQEVVSAVTKLDVLPLLMNLLGGITKLPESLQEAAAQCLHALTEENCDLVERIIGNGDYVSLLLRLRDQLTPDLRGVYLCGSLHNISLAGDTIPGVHHDFVDSKLLPVLTGFLELAPSVSTTDVGHKSLIFRQTTLEILADIAMVAADAPPEGTHEADHGDYMDSSGDDESGASPPRTIDESLHEDMEMVVGDESKVAPPVEGAMFQYFIAHVSPIVLSIANPATGNPLSVQSRALSVLNNIAWAVNSITSETLLNAVNGWGWADLARKVWDSCITPVVKTNTADIELAEAIAGLSWAVSTSLRGNVDISHGQHNAFISLYHAAQSDELRTKCVGLLGSLGLQQGRVDANREIGVFLMTLIDCAADTPANPLIEALNSIFDIYADHEFDYDEPVFVRHGFVEHLSKAVPIVKSTFKKIDRRKSPEDRQRADDTLRNLCRFIKYKTAEKEGTNISDSMTH